MPRLFESSRSNEALARGSRKEFSNESACPLQTPRNLNSDPPLGYAGVKLREHPLMTRKSGIKLWPPPWTSSMQDKPHWTHGEVGTLERVYDASPLGNVLIPVYRI